VPAEIAALLSARLLGTTVAGSYHTEHPADARVSSGNPRHEHLVGAEPAAFYGQCRVVLSPTRAADASLRALGIEAGRIVRWQPGVDHERFNPARYAPDVLPSGTFNVLYVGRLSRDQGLDLLAEAFGIARDRDPRLHLVLAGHGPEEDPLCRRLGRAATFLGRVQGDALARVFASADLLVFPSGTDTFGQVILEAQASGLPVLAVDAGAAAELIESGRSGCLVPSDPETLASALRGLARRGAICDRLATGGLHAVRERSWERSLAQLADGWAQALGAPAVEVQRAA
jgi:glycosyltransferase involved in cell wall biosynthesis